MLDQIRAAEQAARAEALREAAELVPKDKCMCWVHTSKISNYRHRLECPRRIYDSIRALGEK
jgi:hypothetical protein